MTRRQARDISILVSSVAADLDEDRPAAFGFECPLYVPFSRNPGELTAQRPGERGRPWSAAGGAASLATGLAETVWILQRLIDRLQGPAQAFLAWQTEIGRGLFLWEAMVTGKAKGASHEEDSEIAVRAFRSWASGAAAPDAAVASEVHSLIGAALLRTGWK